MGRHAYAPRIEVRGRTIRPGDIARAYPEPMARALRHIVRGKSGRLDQVRDLAVALEALQEARFQAPARPLNRNPRTLEVIAAYRANDALVGMLLDEGGLASTAAMAATENKIEEALRDLVDGGVE